MGDLLQFPTDRVRRAPAAAPDAACFYFDVCDPFSYLAAERVERTLGDVEWIVVDGGAVCGPRPRGRALHRHRVDAEARAAALALPLLWPERFPAVTPHARRATALACELGAGPAFVLALHRLAFCGGFELDDPEVIAEAAAAAGVPLGACLEAGGESWRDDAMRDGAAMLLAAGIDTLPAFAVDGRWFVGETGLAAAGTVRARPGALACRPLVPVG